MFFSSVEISVEIMQRRLDPEGLGIILLNAFMDEFYPQESRSTPDTFDLMHYNGIPGSNEGNKVSKNNLISLLSLLCIYIYGCIMFGRFDTLLDPPYCLRVI